MWNINYDECLPGAICPVSAATRVGGSQLHDHNKPSVVNTDEEMERFFGFFFFFFLHRINRKTDGKTAERHTDGVFESSELSQLSKCPYTYFLHKPVVLDFPKSHVSEKQ